MSKYKSTGCARFFLFLLIFVPIAYFGASYLMESGKMDQIKEKVDEFTTQMNDGASTSSTEPASSNEFDEEQIRRQIADLLNRIETQKTIIEEQEQTIAKQKKMIDDLMSSSDSGASQPETVQASLADSTSNDGNEPSLKDLLKEADEAIKNNN